MDKKSIELLKHRVIGPEYRRSTANHDKVLERRKIMRQLLLNSRFSNSSNEVLDSLRIDILSDCFIVEDKDGYETIVHKKAIE